MRHKVGVWMDKLFSFSLPPYAVQEKGAKDFYLQFLMSEIIHVSVLMQKKKNKQLLGVLISCDPLCMGSLDKILCYAYLLWGKKEVGLQRIKEQLHLGNLKEELKDIFLRLIPTLQKAKENENVLLLLLKKKKEIDALIAPFTLQKILHKMYPDREELQKIVVSNYEKRGFGDYIKAHLHLLEYS